MDGEDWIFLQREHIPMMNRCLKFMKYQESGGSSGMRLQQIHICTHSRIDQIFCFMFISEDHGIILAPISLLVLLIRQLDGDERIPVIPNEGAAEKIVSHPVYAYLPQLGCLWHQMVCMFTNFLAKIMTG
jgi:hypothetical protein